MLLVFFLAFLVLSVALTRAEESDGPPIIDIGALMRGEVSEAVLAQMDAAFADHGVFMVVNHGLSAEEIAQGFTAAQSLFSLPMSSKEDVNINKLTKISHANNSIAESEQVFGRGYLSFGSESGLASIFEPKEGFSYGYPAAHDRARNLLNGPNYWPQGLATDAQHSLESFYLKFTQVASTIARSLVTHRAVAQEKATNLNLEGGELISLMRIFHYFAKKSQTVREFEQREKEQARGEKQALGSSPHTDWGLLTVILQNEVTGLQYLHRGEWKDVPYVPNSLIINIGDFFALSSQGDYHSPIHRVLCPEERDRLSFVLFFYPDYDSQLVTAHNGEEAASRENAQKLQKQAAATREVEVCAQGETCNTDAAKGFNTLTSLQDESGPMKFGDYIVKKWKDVFRANMNN